MAVSSFVGAIWEARLLAKFHERSVVDLITTAPTSVQGNKVVFNKVSDVAVNDYTPGTAITFEGLTTSKVELPLDKQKYFAFQVDDVDAVQAAGDLIDAHVAEAAASLQEKADGVVLAAAMSAGAAITTVAGDLAYDIIVKGNTALNKKRVPKSDRFAIVNSESLEQLQLDERFVRNYTILENGVIEGAVINGTQLVFSEELNGGSYAILVMHKSAMGYAKQLEQVEAMRLEGNFADGVRGLQVYGTVALRPDAIAKRASRPTAALKA